MSKTATPLLVIAGATATGKTGLAIDVATRLAGEGIPAEVISADSRQVYRGLDIGTAKATVEERRGIPHHGLDLVDPDEPFTVADFATHAREALAAIGERGGLAILVGGTGLYLRAVARGIATDELPSDPDVRARLEAEFLAVGLEPLVERLRAVAPKRADAIDTANPRRVVRALEIATVAGGEPDLPAPRGYDGPVAWVGLEVEPDDPPRMDREPGPRPVRRRPDRRGSRPPRAVRPGAPGVQRDRLPRGVGRPRWGADASRPAIAEDARRNQAFAKRQRTWFRSEPDIDWLDGTASPPTDRIVAVGRFLVDARPIVKS